MRATLKTLYHLVFAAECERNMSVSISVTFGMNLGNVNVRERERVARSGRGIRRDMTGVRKIDRYTDRWMTEWRERESEWRPHRFGEMEFSAHGKLHIDATCGILKKKKQTINNKKIKALHDRVPVRYWLPTSKKKKKGKTRRT